MKYLPLQEERSTPDAIIGALAEGGVRFVLGMPGGLTMRLWQALYQHPSIRAVQVREESVGALMAEAYGRLTGSPVAVMGQGEWIVGNAGQAYIEALQGSSPVVILTEMTDGGALSHHAPYQSGTGDYGTWDARAALTGVTKRVMVSHDPAQAVQHTQLALKHALTGQPGPVAVIYHSAALGGSVGSGPAPRLYATEAYLPVPARGLDLEALDQVVEAIIGATRPVIVAGNGVRLSRAQNELAQLARVIDAPVATTSSGKGVFPESDALGSGVIGQFGSQVANAVVGDADLILAVGTKLGPSDTANENPALFDPVRQVMAQIDIEPLNASWTFPMDHVLLGDAAFIMRQLCERYIAAGALQPKNGEDRIELARARHPREHFSEAGALTVPIAAQAIIEMLNETLPSEAVITCDAGENRLFMMHWFTTKSGGEYLQPAAGGGMGYAVPAALASRLADPDRPVLAVCGDGGFAMSIHALMTATQERLPIAVLVLNNGALGWVLHGMGSRPVAAHLDETDYADVARSLGCEGVRVNDTGELRVALKRVANIGVPLVIDVPTSLDTSYADVTNRFD